MQRSRQDPKRARLQALFDTISSWLQDYSNEEYFDLSKTVWDKLLDIQQACEATQWNVPAHHQPDAVPQPDPSGCQQPPRRQSKPPAAPPESSNETLQRQISFLQNQMMELSSRTGIGYSPIASTHRPDVSFGGYIPQGDPDRSVHTPTMPRMPQKHYHQL